jgi:hypothetical protein
MNTALAILIALILSTQNVTPLNAKYMARQQMGLDHSHPQSSCNMHPQYQLPAPEDYLDGDTDPDTAYSDYLSDYTWALELENVCAHEFRPEVPPTIYEDGSYVTESGATGCIPGNICDEPGR